LTLIDVTDADTIFADHSCTVTDWPSLIEASSS
jgi:hypothetical protein